MFTYGSVCSGIEAVSVAWRGFASPLWFSEIEPFACAVLAHHYPEVPNLGDITTLPARILKREVAAPDVLIGGTPCQAFSVAGLRKSLKDERGNLTLVFVRIADAIDKVRKDDGKPPLIILWENVPGVLNTGDNAFGYFLAGLAGEENAALQPPGAKWSRAGMVHGRRYIMWRTLDAQYFGVPQRRNRVYLIATARAQCVGKILFEPESLRGNTTPGKGSEKKTTAYVESGFGAYRRSSVGGTVRANGGTQGHGSETIICVHGTQTPVVSHIAHCLGCNSRQENAVIALASNTINGQVLTGGNGNGFDMSGKCYTVASSGIHGVCYSSVVRRLTPVECERLQGFPDNWTKVPYRNQPAEKCPDTPRYKVIGNSMAVPVIQWIGLRLKTYFL
ncbi:DNA cytosine methyltransferase [Pasteurellaceae bacterium LIM206]|nr:DNA cytosine methyltransferase [Pasteurellaceae bacterium LIM206]